MRRIDDLNARNRAAARNMKSTALSQLSQYAQNKQLMKNMQRSDILNSKIWVEFATQRGCKCRVLQMGSKSRKNHKTKIKTIMKKIIDKMFEAGLIGSKILSDSKEIPTDEIIS